MTDIPYIVVTVECLRCKTKQKVHVAVHPGPAQADGQTVPCIRCNLHFNVTVPDKVIRGPFPA